MFNMFRSVDDGFCSSEQADLIQLHTEKKLRKLYEIDEIVGKSLSNDDDNELDEDDNQEKKSLVINDEENNHRSKPEENPLSMEPTTNKNNTDVDMSSSMDLSNQASPSPPKSNLSPGEIKAISPSSLSEASPISN
jgi:hypothetical protein